MALTFSRYQHGQIDIGISKDPRRRPLLGPDHGYVKKLVKKQTETEKQIDGVWNKLANDGGN